MNDLTNLGFEERVIGTAVGNRTMWVRRGTTKIMKLFIQGFGQKAETWWRTFKDVLADCSDTIMVVERGLQDDAPIYTSRTSLNDQRREMGAIFEALRLEYPYANRWDLIGHSLGGVLAEMLAADYPLQVGHVMVIAPVPEQHFGLLRNWDFWLNGGAWCLPPSIDILIRHPDDGFVVPVQAVPGLFTGGQVPAPAVLEYWQSWRQDSAQVFFDLALSYRGGNLLLAKAKGWTGKFVMVICGSDKLMNFGQLCKDAKKNDAIETVVLGIVPHCYWFVDEWWWKRHTISTLRHALGLIGTSIP